MAKAINLTVLGGFLGAGKTTFINQILSQNSVHNLAILVNDFGKINIDAQLIRHQSDEVIELANGCICCSIGDSLTRTLIDLKRRPIPPEHLIIEASGVANPLKIAQLGMAGNDYALDGILVMADAETLEQQLLDQYVGSTVERQLAAADLILLNKCDLVSPEAQQKLLKSLTRQYPKTPVLPSQKGAMPTKLLVNLSSRTQPFETQKSTTYTPIHNAEDQHELLFDRFSFTSPLAFKEEPFKHWLQQLPSSVLRVKGLIYLAGHSDDSYLVQKVGARWTLKKSIPWGNLAAQTQLVMLGIAGQCHDEQFQAELSEILKN
jgi:G3E family GTPase